MVQGDKVRAGGLTHQLGKHNPIQSGFTNAGVGGLDPSGRVQLKFSCICTPKGYTLQMSQKEKRLLRLLKDPPVKDFTWEELISVMRAAGFRESCSGGSHYDFEHTSGFSFHASKTHPSGLLKVYQIKEARAALKQVGAIPQDSEEQ